MNANQPVAVTWEEGAERLFNLVIALINYGPRSVTWILENVDGYKRPAREVNRHTQEQMLRRDRATLARAGVHITTTLTEVEDDSFAVSGRSSRKESVWSISREDFELPDIEFTDAEAEVISAAGLWAHSKNMSTAAQSAYAKLSALGISRTDSSMVLSNVPDMTTLDADSLDAMFRGLDEHKVIEFYYYPSLVEEPVERHLEPWAFGAIGGKMYLTGFDVDRGAQRTFRLSRIDSIEVTDTPGQQEVPGGTPMELIEQGLARTGQRVTVTVEFPGPGAQELKAMCNADGTIGPIDRDTIVRTAASYAPDAVVTAPPDVVADVVALLTRAAGKEQA
ncbi:WYL domain-containing protein [Corynebacterium zhongnanshanii]|uniref:WYL domain-containing protein n=1 Tax=Corynebacterium zhongnanshanii TaxID=2768834 RepID=A0ABQ6VGG9_9CORY|nr:WYL domain-containing protein [Corynebacterium zhongnanshanii]KAB3523522.1 WYL domain-containing protein [Corynebacterium zhongnanshanii]